MKVTLRIRALKGETTTEITMRVSASLQYAERLGRYLEHLNLQRLKNRELNSYIVGITKINENGVSVIILYEREPGTEPQEVPDEIRSILKKCVSVTMKLPAWDEKITIDI